MGLVAKAFQDIITFSRASSGTYVNSSGYITNSSVLNYLTYSNQPENVAWTKSNSFVQQNIQTYSQDFDNAAWTKVSGGTGSVPVVTANQAIAPDGTLTADFITLNLGGGTTLTDQSNLTGATGTTTTGAPYNGSIYIIAATSADVGKILAFRHAGGSGYSLITLTAAWQRFSVNENAASTTGSITFGLRGTTGASTGSVSFYAWGAQLVQGSVPGDYRATTSAALPCLYADYNGALRARKLCENNAATIAHFMDSSSSTIAAGVFTGFAKIKAGERTSATMYLVDSVGIVSGTVSTFNLTTGVVTSGTQASIVSVGGGYFQCAVYGTCAAGAGAKVRVLLSDGSAYTGDGSSGIYIADAQLNDGSSALAYYDTTASAYNAPRFDYDPVTLAAKGLLVEEQRVNLLTYSNDFATTWTPISVTITQNSTLSPDGNVNADTVAASATAVGSRIQQDLVVSTTSQYVYSCYVRPGTVNTVSLSLYNNTTATALATVNFNVSTGVVVTTTVGSGTITPAGNGWYRCIVTHSGTVTATNSIRAYVYPNNTSGTTGDSVIIYGSQVEAGAFATSYIPTVASQVTRAADVASVNTLSPWFNSVASTVYAEVQSIWTSGSTGDDRSLWSVSGGTNPLLGVVRGSGGSIQFHDETNYRVLPNGTYDNGSIRKVVVALADPATSGNAAINGTSGTFITDGSTLDAGTTALNIGRSTTPGSYWCGWIRRITYYPRQMTLAECSTLTTL